MTKLEKRKSFWLLLLNLSAFHVDNKGKSFSSASGATEAAGGGGGGGLFIRHVLPRVRSVPALSEEGLQF